MQSLCQAQQNVHALRLNITITTLMDYSHACFVWTLVFLLSDPGRPIQAGPGGKTEQAPAGGARMPVTFSDDLST